MDNECSAAVEKYIRSEKINIQLVPPTTIKSTLQNGQSQHLKSILLLLLQLWTCTALSNYNYGMNFLPQVELTFTLNMLRFSRLNPNRSANQEVYGIFDFKDSTCPTRNQQSTHLRQPSITCILGPPSN